MVTTPTYQTFNSVTILLKYKTDKLGGRITCTQLKQLPNYVVIYAYDHN